MPRINMLRRSAHQQFSSEYSCRVTTCGGMQAILATLWLTALAVAFVTALGGLSGVEECLSQELPPPPPPPRPPPPPSPHPPPPPRPVAQVCTFQCRLQAGDRRCNPACNTPQCRYDGGDCAHSTTSSTPARRPQTLDDLIRSGVFGRRLAQARQTYSYAPPTARSPNLR